MMKIENVNYGKSALRRLLCLFVSGLLCTIFAGADGGLPPSTPTQIDVFAEKQDFIKEYTEKISNPSTIESYTDEQIKSDLQTEFQIDPVTVPPNAAPAPEDESLSPGWNWESVHSLYEAFLILRDQVTAGKTPGDILVQHYYQEQLEAMKPAEEEPTPHPSPEDPAPEEPETSASEVIALLNELRTSIGNLPTQRNLQEDRATAHALTKTVGSIRILAIVLVTVCSLSLLGVGVSIIVQVIVVRHLSSMSETLKAKSKQPFPTHPAGKDRASVNTLESLVGQAERANMVLNGLTESCRQAADSLRKQNTENEENYNKLLAFFTKHVIRVEPKVTECPIREKPVIPEHPLREETATPPQEVKGYIQLKGDLYYPDTQGRTGMLIREVASVNGMRRWEVRPSEELIRNHVKRRETNTLFEFRLEGADKYYSVESPSILESVPTGGLKLIQRGIVKIW